MLITPVDNEPNLYRVEDAMPPELVEKILKTPWLELPWCRQEGQESWARRRINDDVIPWMIEWELACHRIWQDISQAVGFELENYMGTAWWLDEPGFTCSMHTDGELPGSMQLTWIGANEDLGTSFYWYRDPASKRYQFPMRANTGYIMINRPNNDGYRNLLWHAMLTPVPPNTFRLTSYSWIRTL